MWQHGNRGRGRGRNQGTWPGRGPFSHLPPWQRPGWLYGPGSCWYLHQKISITPSNQKQSKVSPRINFCKTCNATLLPNANYCASCGTKINIPNEQDPL